MAVSGTRRSIAARKFARNRVWHTLGLVRKQSQCTIAFHYIDLRTAVTGTRRLCPRRDRALLSRQLVLARPPCSFSRVYPGSISRERVLRSPPSFPFPPPINNFIRRSRERAAVVNYRAARRRSQSREAARPDLDVLPELSENRKAAKYRLRCRLRQKKNYPRACCKTIWRFLPAAKYVEWREELSKISIFVF